MMPFVSMSLIDIKNGVSTSTTWNSMVPIGVRMLIEPIDGAEPIPKVALTASFVVVSIGTLMSKVFW
jgi:hypothetical protein